MVALTSEIVYDLKTLEIARQIPENHAELDNLHVGKPWKATCRSFPQGFMAFRHLRKNKLTGGQFSASSPVMADGWVMGFSENR